MKIMQEEQGEKSTSGGAVDQQLGTADSNVNTVKPSETIAGEPASQAQDAAPANAAGSAASPAASAEPQPQPNPAALAENPMKGTALGDILDRIRGAIHRFENHVALEEHDLAKEVHDFIVDNVNELRGHFRS